MKRAKIVKMWTELGDERPRIGDFEDYMNRPMNSGPYGFISACDVFEYLTRGDFWWMYLGARRMDCSRRVAKLKAAVRRPRYYEAENERRRALAAARRKIRARATTNACPTREAILGAWNRRRDSHEAAIRFGSLLEDLECYLDNSLRRDEDGVIIGRNPGIKGWLCENLPEVSEKYTTAMRYKAAAKKLKQVAELADPTPADVVLPQGWAERKDEAKRDYGADEIAGGGVASAGEAMEWRGGGSTETCAKGRGEGRAERRGEGKAAPELAIVRARAIWLEVVAGIGPGATALMARLDALTDPERVEDANMLAAWREKYANEITERTKRRWWRRLAKAARGRCGEEVPERGGKVA
ncbi:MAG: hypothetical protein IJI73_01920 [Kiritimatiellae bacterium]|nr:hypothetical protein [Kiritimatiellia bacterium]